MKKKAKLVSRATGLGLLCIMFFSCKEKTSNQIQNEIQNQTSISSPQKGMQEHIPNYADGNGTILSSFSKDGVSTIIRKCEMNVTIGQMLSEDGHTMYKDHNRDEALAIITDGDTAQILQTCAIRRFNEPKSEWGSVSGEHWYKIKYEGQEGWICSSDTFLGGMNDPYENNRFEILETISCGEKSWTVRKMEQMLSVWENLNIREKPGLNDNVVVYTIRPGDSDPTQTNVQTLAITEESDTIDGITDRWVKISYKEHEGWIFGGYTSAERGGPRYYIPENWIAFDLGDLP